MAGLGGAEGHFRGLLVTDLADHDDLRVVPEKRPQVAGEGVADGVVDLRLAQLVVDVLHGILGRENADLRAMELHQDRVERRRLAGARGAGHQEDARGALEQHFEAAGDGRREMELLDGARRSVQVQDADDHALPRVARDDRDAQVDGDRAACALDGDLEAAVLRPTTLGDVEGGENLDAGHDLPHVVIEAVLQATEVRLAEHAVHPVPHVQPGRQHLQMDVATVVLEGARQDLPEELIGPPARLLVEEHRRAEGGDGHLHLGDHVVTELFAGLRRAIVEAAKRALDGAARSGDDGDGQARQPPEVVDQGYRRRAVYGDGYRAADRRDGPPRITPRVDSAHQARQAAIET